MSNKLGVLYDMHGNLPALDAVLDDASRAGVDRWVLGGDYAVFGPWPRETLERLRGLENASWLRGNGERWLVEPPDIPERRDAVRAALQELSAETVARLATLPSEIELGDHLFVHASPLSDELSFAAEATADDERLLAGVRERVVVFGHGHRQFRRPGPNGADLVSPGSVGAPIDGDNRAAWALYTDHGTFELRRCEYDVERAAARMRELGEWGVPIAERLELGADPPWRRHVC